MSQHDIEISTYRPSLLAIGSIYIALRICEQFQQQILVKDETVMKLIQVSQTTEQEILEVSQKLLYLA